MKKTTLAMSALDRIAAVVVRRADVSLGPGSSPGARARHRKPQEGLTESSRPTTDGRAVHPLRLLWDWMPVSAPQGMCAVDGGVESNGPTLRRTIRAYIDSRVEAGKIAQPLSEPQPDADIDSSGATADFRVRIGAGK